MLEDSQNNRISKNRLVARITSEEAHLLPLDFCGIFLRDSSNNSLVENDITSRSWGIWLDNSSNNRIAGNSITMSIDGLFLYNSSNNLISENNITNSQRATVLKNSSNNKFFHNNFIFNGEEVYFMSPCINVWDDGYPSGGNFWSDYEGKDEKMGPSQDKDGEDGIGDTPYVIDENNRDNYPLMGPWPLKKGEVPTRPIEPGQPTKPTPSPEPSEITRLHLYLILVITTIVLFVGFILRRRRS